MTDASSPTRRFGGQRLFAPVELTIGIVDIIVFDAIALPPYAHSPLRIGAGRSWDGS